MSNSSRSWTNVTFSKISCGNGEFYNFKEKIFREFLDFNFHSLHYVI